MKTKDLIRTLEILGACAPGIDELQQYDTVNQWWMSTESGSYMVWLWIAICAAYPDEDVLQRDVQAMFEKNGTDIPLSRLCRRRMGSIEDFVDGLGFDTFPYCMRDDLMAEWMRFNYRCPSDAELRHLIRMLKPSQDNALHMAS